MNPEVVLFDRFMTEEKFGWRVAEVCPKALRILDTEDLHCLRYARQKAVMTNVEFNNNLLMNDKCLIIGHLGLGDLFIIDLSKFHFIYLLNLYLRCFIILVIYY